MKISDARRIALAAQGMGRDRDRVATPRDVARVISQVGQFQIDTVNVLARAHLMPLYTRLGAYDPALLEQVCGGGHAGILGLLPQSKTRITPVSLESSASSRRLFEYWGHAACLINVDLYPALRFRMEDAYTMTWGRIRTLADESPTLIEDIFHAVSERGPVTARDLDLGEDKVRDHWGWNWSQAKTALEWLFWCGRVAVARRNTQFERMYDLPERVIPAPVLTSAALDSHEAHVTLIRTAAQALGIASARCLGDYFRTASAPTKTAIAELEAAGELTPVDVDGWKQPTWVWSGASSPKPVRSAALVSPFDSLIFERQRLRNLFGVDYTISLYTPAHKRVHGYYVYLFLLDDAFAARVDLKADRKKGVLLVQSAWWEESCQVNRERVVTELARELRRCADWLGLGEVCIMDKGNLSRELAAVASR